MAGERKNPEVLKDNIAHVIQTAPTECIQAFDGILSAPPNDLLATSRLQRAIVSLSYVTPDMESMRPLYGRFTKSIRTGPLPQRLLAYALSNIMLHETSLPVEQRAVHQNASATDRRRFALASASLFKNIPVSEEVASMRRGLTEAATFFRVELYEATSSQNPTVDQLTGQIELVNTLFSETPFTEFEETAGDPQWNAAMHQIRDKGVATVAANPLSKSLLLSGDLINIHDDIQREVLLSAMVRDIGSEVGKESDASELATFYFKHKNFHPYFWEAVFDEPAAYRDVVHWFFRQPQDRDLQFLTTALPDEEDWRVFTKKEKSTIFRKIAGLVATYQKHYASDTATNTSLHTYIDALAAERGMQKTITPIMSVLTNEQPGIVYIDQQGEARVLTPSLKETPDKFAGRVDASGHAVVYQSQAETIKSVVTTPKESVASKEGHLILEATEDLESFRWIHAHVIREGDVTKLSNHLTERLQMDETEEEAWFDYVTTLQESSQAKVGDFPAIFPELLPPGHRIQIIQRAGVVSVESAQGVVSVVIDPEMAQIQTDNPGLLVLQGSIDDDGFFVPANSTADALGLALQLVITGTAQFAMRDHRGKTDITDDEHRNIQDAVRDYTSAHKYDSFPILIAPKKGIEVPNVLGETVLVPTGNKGQMIPLLLEFGSKVPNEVKETLLKDPEVAASLAEPDSLRPKTATVIVDDRSESEVQGGLVANETMPWAAALQDLYTFIGSLSPPMGAAASVLERYFVNTLFARQMGRSGEALGPEVFDQAMQDVLALTIQNEGFPIALQRVVTNAFHNGFYKHLAADQKISTREKETAVNRTPKEDIVEQEPRVIVSDAVLSTQPTPPVEKLTGKTQDQQTSKRDITVTKLPQEHIDKAQQSQAKPEIGIITQRRAEITEVVTQLKALVATGMNPDYHALCNAGAEAEALANRIQSLIGFGPRLIRLLAAAPEPEGTTPPQKETTQKYSSDTPVQSVVRTIVSFPGQFKDLGNCRTLDPDALFVTGAAQNNAKLICRGCDVQKLCLAYAIETDSRFGVWGGTTERERRAIVRRTGDTEELVQELRQQNITELRERYL